MEKHTPDQAPEPSAADNLARLGKFYAFGSATFLGLNTALARLAYDGGSNPGTVAFLRIGMTVAIVGLLIVFTRRHFFMPKAALLPTIGVAVAVVFQGTAYLSSVAYIPVGLAVLLFYTYPLMVAAASWIVDRHDVSRGRLIALVFAFCGTGLAVGPSFDVLDWRGIVLALMGAFGLMGIFMFSARAMRHCDAVSVSFYSNVFALPMMAVAMMFLGGYETPTTSLGIGGLLSLCIVYALAILMQYAAIHAIGKTFTALLSNIEPLVSIAAGALLLGEILTGIQYLGGMIVVSALVISDWVARRPQRNA